MAQAQVIKIIKRSHGFTYLVECLYCYKHFKVSASQYHLSKTKYCSYQCTGKATGFSHLKHQKGSKHPKWKGGKVINQGYIYLWKADHPSCTKHKYVAEHRLIMEAHLGRYLKSHEKIHHINGIKNDNRIENLALVTIKTHHNGRHYQISCCPNCGIQLADRYGTGGGDSNDKERFG